MMRGNAHLSDVRLRPRKLVVAFVVFPTDPICRHFPYRRKQIEGRQGVRRAHAHKLPPSNESCGSSGLGRPVGARAQVATLRPLSDACWPHAPSSSKTPTRGVARAPSSFRRIFRCRITFASRVLF